MSYTIDRYDAARELGMSTRTIDRHIASGRVRSRRMGKKVFLHEDDVRSLSGQVEIVPRSEEEKGDTTTTLERSVIHRESGLTLPSEVAEQIEHMRSVISELQVIIKDRDDRTKTLAYQLGQSELKLKESIPLIEHTKAMYLVQAADEKKSQQITDMTDERTRLEQQAQEMRSNMLALAILTTILVLALALFVVI